MRNHAPLQRLLSSLSSLTTLDFKLWDTKGLVFSSGTNGTDASNLKEHEVFSGRIMQQASFQSRCLEGRQPMFGIPIKYGTEIIGSLVASCSDAHQSSLSQDSRAIATHDARKMETFLTDLGGLAEETLVNRKEIDELAEELSQNFEDLSLYARITTQMRSLQFSGEMTKSLIKELQETHSLNYNIIRRAILFEFRLNKFSLFDNYRSPRMEWNDGDPSLKKIICSI